MVTLQNELTRLRRLLSRQAATSDAARVPRSPIPTFVTLTFSTVAFAISVYGFYVNNIVRADDVKVIVINQPETSVSNSPLLKWARIGTLSINGPLSLLFVNSGNQPASIVSVSITFLVVTSALDDRTQLTCNPAPIYEAGVAAIIPGKYDIQPVIVKSSELASVTLDPSKFSYGVLQRDPTIQELAKGKPFGIVSCVYISLAAPHASETIRAPGINVIVWEYRFDAKDQVVLDNEYTDDPIISHSFFQLMKHTGSILADWSQER